MSARRLPVVPLAALGLALLMGGCAPSDTDPGPGGVSVGEARALDRAAEMLEDRRPAADLLASGTPQPAATEGAAAN